MKHFKHGLLALAAVVGLGSTLFYAACEKDSCTDLQCKNGGSCADNFCRCKTGFEGAECEIKQADRFIGKWGGSTRCTQEVPDQPIGPNVNDTLTIFMKQEPVTVGLVLRQKPTDTLTGTVSGQQIIVADRTNGNSKYTYNIRINGQNINYFVVYSRDVNQPSTQTNCTFVGFGPIVK